MLNKSIQLIVNTLVVPIMGRKGGITKTTLAVNLALFLARLFGLRVLLIETDGQGDATSSVGLPLADDFHRLIIGNAEWADVLVKVPETFAGDADLWMLRAADQQLDVERNAQTPSILVERMAELDGNFDIIIVDSGPNLAETHIGLYYAATSGGSQIILPTTIERKPIDSLERMFGYLSQARMASSAPVAEVLAIQPNRFATSKRVSHRLLGQIEGRYGHRTKVMAPIRDLAAWEYASVHQRSILDIGGYHAAAGRSELQPLVNLVYQKFLEVNPHVEQKAAAS